MSDNKTVGNPGGLSDAPEKCIDCHWNYFDRLFGDIIHRCAHPKGYYHPYAGVEDPIPDWCPLRGGEHMCQKQRN